MHKNVTSSWFAFSWQNSYTVRIHMKTWLFNLALTSSLFAATLPIRAADQPAATSAPANTSGIGPKIKFDSVTYDFGRVVSGTLVKHDYVFTNVGDATLKITGVQPGCGCTTVGEWTHEVEPGKTGVIPIQFNSTMYSTPVTKTPSITCNDKSQPVVRFQLHGTVYKTLQVMPNYASLIIPPDGNGEASAVVHIVNNDPQPLTLEQPKSNVGTFTAELKTNAPGKDYDLIVKTAGALSTATGPGQITIATSSKSTPSISIPVIVSMQPLMNIMPAALTIPAGPITNSESVSVFLRNNGTNAVALSDPSVNTSGVEAAISISQPGKVYAVTATFPSGFQMPVGKSLTLTVKTDNPRFPTVQVPIRQTPAPFRAAAPAPPVPQHVRVITQ